jgi:hypothetical protein
MRQFVLFAWAALLPCAALAQTPLATVDAYRGRPLTTGAWTLILAADSSEARFGEVGRPARLTLRCDMIARRVRISRPDRPPGPMTIVTTSVTRTLTAPAEVLAFEPLLDAIVFSRGRFVVRSDAAGSDALIIPAWPEAARIVEDCRK